MNDPTFVPRLFDLDDPEAQRALGTHLYPLHTFGLDRTWPHTGDLAAATEIVARFPAVLDDELQVSMTRIGGLYVPVPDRLTGRNPERKRHATRPLTPWHDPDDPKFAFEQQAVDAMNLVVCELSLLGLESEPASVAELGSAALSPTRATVRGSGGPYMERTMAPALALGLQPMAVIWQPAADGLLDAALPLTASRRLHEVSPALPTFVAAAFSLFARRLLAECLTDSWISCELVLANQWEEHYRAHARDSGHRKRLHDDRSFTANIKAELLYANGTLSGGLYDQIQKARKHRNDLMHGGAVKTSAVLDGLAALRGLLQLVLGHEVAHPAMRWSSFF